MCVYIFPRYEDLFKFGVLVPCILCLIFMKYGGPQLSRQIKIHDSKFKIHRSKFKFTTANSNSLQQIQIRHGKFKFTTANLEFTAANSSSPRQKFKFTAANSNSPRQIQIHHRKFRVCLLYVLVQELGLSLGALGWFW